MGRHFLKDAETCGHSVGVRRGMWGDVIFWQVLPEEEAKDSSLLLPLLRLSSSRDPSVFLLLAWCSVSLGQADDHQ